MTREIKLRYWNGVSNQMVYEPEIRSDYKFSLNEYLNTDRGWIWMQFTGLLDKNGKEIYEGDIVKSIEERGDELGDYTEELKQEVFFDGCAFYPVCTAPSENWEVIGNIYQNKTLLNI